MYLFLDINNRREITDTEQINFLFNISEEMMKRDFICIDDINLLKNNLDDENYFIIHEFIIAKGKKKILKGKVIETDKNSMFEYLNQNINDLRPLRIIPKKKQNKLIYVNDEGAFFLYQK